ncbi:MAG TPA: M14 family zinc carboxypeptidase, partial [Candidatus Saccharimonadales bacterium]|nr:M14 family zinc carboxypeptidase [Candidatus Saccharimonadales bacterium]
MSSRRISIPAIALLLILTPVAGAEAPLSPAAPETLRAPAPVPLEGLDYTPGLFPDADYDPAIPGPGSILGFPVGSRMATPEQIGECLDAWAAASDRMKVVEYARSPESRPLWYAVVTSPANMKRLDAIRKGYAEMADPENLSGEEGDRLVGSLPSVAWLAYSIHGNETSGSDAALAVIYHLIAARNESVRSLLDATVVIVDPMMNPDGRARTAKQLTEHRGTMPNVDDQSLLHGGYWPWGRMNHYLFDLNRDWILGVQPESRGRIRAAGAWHPLLFVDAHEMEPQGTYLFSPQRAPRNPFMPSYFDRWGDTFSRDQAAAFDRRGWTYYTGEWNEGWYPGYSDSWAAFRGAIGILYEQARVAEDAVRRPHGVLLPYMEAVHHQMTSSLANLESLKAHGEEIRKDFLADRRKALSATGPWAGRTFAVLPTRNAGRLERFVDLMNLQGIRVYRTEKPFTVESAVDQLGREKHRVTVPAGALLVPNRQPEARLAAAMLAFDTPMPPEYTSRERREILRTGQSTIYDLTAWNITMMYGLDALTLASELPPDVVPVGGGPAAATAQDTPAGSGERPNMYIFDGADDRSVSVAARLMEAGLEVRVAQRDFEFEGAAHSRGSVVVLLDDNLRTGHGADEVAAAVRKAGLDSGMTPSSSVSGLGPGDLPDIGGGRFTLLEPPEIGLLARGAVSGYDLGAIWNMLDTEIGIRHSELDESTIGRADLRRYNVLVLPDRRGRHLPASLLDGLGKWIESGGTLIAIGDAAAALAEKEPGISKVRRLPDVLDSLDSYEVAVRREWLAREGPMPPDEAIWSHVAGAPPEGPWLPEIGSERPDKDVLEARDAWDRMFMPAGAFVAARTDPESWLTFGTPEVLPVLESDAPVLMAAGGIEVPVRFGVFEPAGAGAAGKTPDAG